MAIAEAREGIVARDGGPFGSVIVKDGLVVGKGHNTVLRDHDSTCHGEMMAIRDACHNLNSHDLSGCVLYTTGEPCDMCLCATLWANIERVYYGCSIAENARIGFRDQRFDELFGGRDKLDGYLLECDREECLCLFDDYLATNPQRY